MQENKFGCIQCGASTPSQCRCPDPVDLMLANKTQVGGDHYARSVSGENLQHWDICWQLGFDQFQYCITKYVFRHKYKNGLEDLKKAQHHLAKYIEVLEAENGRE